MKISLFNQFGAKNSAPVFDAIAHGLRAQGQQVVWHDMNADAAVIWSMLWTGRMHKNREVWHAYRGRPIIVAEVGMIQRGRTWKIGLGGTGISSYKFNNLLPNRAAGLGLKLQPWKTGENIVIAMQRGDSEQWQGQPTVNKWLADTVTEIKRYTNKNIVVRPHPRSNCAIPANCQIDRPKFTSGTYDDFDYARTLQSAHCVLSWSSGPGPQALIAGVPAFVGPNSLASTISNWELSQIENPPHPDRTLWLEQLAHTEWTVEEITSGLPFKHLGV